MSKAIQFKDQNNNNIYPNPHYPVGSIYLSISDVDPNTYFGGTWKQIAQGRTLVGVDINDTDFNTVEKIGGSKTHILTIDEMPSHSHTLSNLGDTILMNVGSSYGTYIGRGSKNTNTTGGGQAHNNLQPYFTCYIWLRTA